MTKAVKVITTEEYINVVTKQLTGEVLSYMLEVEQLKGVEVSKLVANAFVDNFIAALVYRYLTERPPGATPKTTNKEALEHVKKNFVTIKVEMQDAVAMAFQKAMSAFSGKDMEYYCEIKPMPEAINKHPC